MKGAKRESKLWTRSIALFAHQSVRRAKLIDEVVNAIIDPDLIVIDTVLTDYAHDMLATKAVCHFDIVKDNGDTARRAARDVGDAVGLDSDLHWVEVSDEWKLDMKSGLGHSIEQCAAARVGPDVTLRHCGHFTGGETKSGRNVRREQRRRPLVDGTTRAKQTDESGQCHMPMYCKEMDSKSIPHSQP
jgi:hypothetical protein